MSEQNFADGMFFYEPKETQKHFLYGNMSIRPDVFCAWIKQQPTNEKGFVQLQALKSKNTGKPYVTLNTYQITPRASGEATEGEKLQEDEIISADIPW